MVTATATAPTTTTVVAVTAAGERIAVLRATGVLSLRGCRHDGESGDGEQRCEQRADHGPLLVADGVAAVAACPDSCIRPFEHAGSTAVALTRLPFRAERAPRGTEICF